MYAYDALKAGSSDIIVAGGMESMTNAPYLLTKARGGYRMGQGAIYDHMMMDGLEDAYDIAPDGTRRSMGTFGEDCATQYAFTREAAGPLRDDVGQARAGRRGRAARSPTRSRR